MMTTMTMMMMMMPTSTTVGFLSRDSSGVIPSAFYPPDPLKKGRLHIYCCVFVFVSFILKILEKVPPSYLVSLTQDLKSTSPFPIRAAIQFPGLPKKIRRKKKETNKKQNVSQPLIFNGFFFVVLLLIVFCSFISNNTIVGN